MKKRLINILVVLIGVTMASVVILDLDYRFGNYDTAFAIGSGLYVSLWLLKKFAVKWLFISLIPLLLSMALSFSYQGPVRLTERLGEWLVILFIIGLIHYGLTVSKSRDLDL